MLQATEFCQRVLKPVLLPGRAFAQQLCRPSNRPCTRVRYYPDEPDVVRWQHERLPELVNLEETFSCKKDLDDFGFTCWCALKRSCNQGGHAGLDGLKCEAHLGLQDGVSVETLPGRRGASGRPAIAHRAASPPAAAPLCHTPTIGPR